MNWEQIEALKTTWGAWWPVLLSIPLSILANILTDPFKTWMSHWSKNRARKRIVELQRELATTEDFRDNPIILTNFLLARLSPLVVLMGLIVILLLDVRVTDGHDRIIAEIQQLPHEPSLSNRVFTLFSGMMLAFITWRAGWARKIVDRIGRFEDYRKRTLEQIAELEARIDRGRKSPN